MWPLDNNQLRIINENMKQLIELLDSGDDLIFSLMATNCFNRRQIDALKCITDINERNVKLLEMLKRRAVEHLNKFIQCLQNIQRHLVPLLTGDAGT